MFNLKLTLKTKLVALVFSVSIILTSLLTIIFYHHVLMHVRQIYLEEKLFALKAISAMIDGDTFQKLTQLEQENTILYKKYTAQLGRIKRHDPLITYLYTLTYNTNHELVYGVQGDINQEDSFWIENDLFSIQIVKKSAHNIEVIFQQKRYHHDFDIEIGEKSYRIMLDQAKEAIHFNGNIIFEFVPNQTDQAYVLQRQLLSQQYNWINKELEIDHLFYSTSFNFRAKGQTETELGEKFTDVLSILNEKKYHLDHGQDMVRYDPETGKYGQFISVATPIINAQGKPVGLLIAELYQDKIEALDQELKTRLIYILLLVFCLIYIMTAYFSRHIVTPIVTLSKVAYEVAKGDYQVSSPLIRHDELGSLSDSVNTMIYMLKEHVNILEQCIAQKTADLQQALSRFENMFKQNQAIMYMFDVKKLKLIDANPAALKFYGYTEQEFLTLTLPDLFVERNEILSAYLDHLVSHRSLPPLECKQKLADHTICDMLFFASLVEVSENKHAYLAIVMDISESKVIQSELHLASLVIHSMTEGMLITDKDMKIISINPAFEKITGYSMEEVQGQSPRILSATPHFFEYVQNIKTALCDVGKWQGELQNRRKDGSCYPQWTSIFAIRDNYQCITQYAAVMTDISEQKQVEDLVWKKAHYDPLTNLANRAYFLEQLTSAISLLQHHKEEMTNQFLGLFFLDLDQFKEVNDQYGHAIGDILIKLVAERLQNSVRTNDLLGRLGGDEFLIALPALETLSTCEHIAQEIIQTLNQVFVLDQNRVYIGCSVGISVCTEAFMDPQRLIAQADEAMYVAKRNGKNQFAYYEMDTSSSSLVNKGEKDAHH